jgi:hypothetical protein
MDIQCKVEDAPDLQSGGGTTGAFLTKNRPMHMISIFYSLSFGTRYLRIAEKATHEKGVTSVIA